MTDDLIKQFDRELAIASAQRASSISGERRKGRFETWLDGHLIRAVYHPVSWWWFAGRWLLYVAAIYTLFIAPVYDPMSMTRWLTYLTVIALAIAYMKPGTLQRLARLTLYLGQTFPYLLRPWYWLAKFMRTYVLDKVRVATVRTMFLRRLFSLEWHDGTFKTSYAINNWVAVLALLYCLPTISMYTLDGLYAYLTYPFGTYSDIIVTQAYRNISDQNTYAVHGYKMIDGVKHEYYFELGSNIWFWQLYPEYVFGQVPILGRCTFETYGITLRIPQKLRLFSAGSLYALNPWIVNMQCTAPNIVPKD